jgi:putative oxidoreductase
MGLFQSFVAFLGRACIGVLFLGSGINEIINWQAAQGSLMQTLTDWLTLNVGNPLTKQTIEWCLANTLPLLIAAVAFQIVGALLVFLGFWVRFGAFLLFLFMIGATIIYHHFWQLMPTDRGPQIVDFMKNLGIAGGVLILLALGKGEKGKKSDAEAS